MDQPVRGQGHFFCTTCGTALRLGVAPAGERMWCHSCGAHTRVPDALRSSVPAYAFEPSPVAEPSKLPRARWVFRGPATLGSGCMAIALLMAESAAHDPSLNGRAQLLAAISLLFVPLALLAVVLFPAAFPIRSSRLEWLEIGGLSLMSLVHVLLIFAWLSRPLA